MMDDDSYMSMTEDYKLIKDENEDTSFFSAKEIINKKLSMKKDDVNWNDISGNPRDVNLSKSNPKQIRESKVVEKEQGVCGNETCGLKEEKKVIRCPECGLSLGLKPKERDEFMRIINMYIDKLFGCDNRHFFFVKNNKLEKLPYF